MSDLYDIFVRAAALPMSVEAVVLPNDDNTYDIYVNDRIGEEARNRALLHELTHIKKNHFQNGEPVIFNELEAG